MPSIVTQASVTGLPAPAYYRWAAQASATATTYQLDYTSTLAAGDSIRSVVVSIAPAYIAGGLASGAVATSGAVAICLLSGGLAGQDYEVLWTATTAQGATTSVVTMLYCPPLLAAVPQSWNPPQTGGQVLSAITQNFPISPVGLTVGAWWNNAGIPQQITGTLPLSPVGLFKGSLWLNNGVVAQIATTGSAAQNSSQVLAGLLQGLPLSPVGLTPGAAWNNAGILQQVVSTLPTSPAGLTRGAFWLNNGVVTQA